MNPTKYIQPVMVQALFDMQDGKILRIKTEHEETLKKLELYDKVLNLKKQFTTLPGDIVNDNQTAEIANNIMPTINFILKSLQSSIVTIKQTLNSISTYIAGNQTSAQFKFSDAEQLDIIRKTLLSQCTTVNNVAKLFKVVDGKLELQDGINFPNYLQNTIDTIKNTIAHDIGTTNQAEKLQDIQNSTRWYEFDALERSQYKTIVNLFKTSMESLTDLLIHIISMMKDIINYICSAFRDKPLLEKNSFEMLGDIKAANANPMHWAEFCMFIKNQKDVEIAKN